MYLICGCELVQWYHTRVSPRQAGGLTLAISVSFHTKRQNMNIKIYSSIHFVIIPTILHCDLLYVKDVKPNPPNSV